MGLFDSILGLNTNKAQANATQAADKGIASTAGSNATELYNTATSAGNEATTGANLAAQSLAAGTAAGQAQLGQYGAQAQNDVQNGVNQAVGTVTGSNGQYAPYVANGQGANNLYADSLGVNGAGGNTAATNAFQASPGYQWQVQQASDNAARHAASLGMAGSGNTLDAITRLGSNLANQEYGNWQTNLSGLGNTGLSAANAVSGNNAAAAGYQYGGGALGGQLSQSLGGQLAGQQTALGQGEGNLQASLGNTLSNIQSNLGTNSVNNNWQGTNGITSNNLNLASAQDATSNANNGIFSKLIGGALNGGLSSLKL